MRHEGIRNEKDGVVQTTASDLKAVAEDMLRMGRHWARAAQGWLERAGDEAQRQASRTRSDRDLQSDYGGRDYRGVGPRNYTRSDERIREDLNERLTEAYDLDAGGITVEVENGVATLSGSVPQRWMKHRAEDLVDACIGVRDVHNRILVGGEAAGTASGTTTRTTRTTSGATGTSTSTTGRTDNNTGKETP
jgi:hypothetical protein